LGFDLNRVHLLIAVLDKHLDLELATSDVFVNAVGGLKLSEPAADLAVASALISTAQSQEISAQSCFFGEVGLTGEIRAAAFAEERIREGIKLGFKEFVVPESNQKHLKSLASSKDIQFRWLQHVNELPKCLRSPSKARERAPDMTAN
jgi:DNA repair protein RadA/Sms